MSIIQGIILGLVQGLTEFLPISSSGHLVLVPYLLGWQLPSVAFDVFVHIGTLIAVVSYFWRDIVSILRTDRRIILIILVATVPATILGFAYEEFFEGLFGRPMLVSMLLFVTGAVLWLTEGFTRQRRRASGINFVDGLIVGIAQAAAIAPGISRSGVTIAAAMARGYGRETSARFSFLLAVPIIFGAGLQEVAEGRFHSSQLGLPVAFGFAAAAVSGYVAIKYLLNHLKKGNLKVFAYYCWIFAGITVVVSYLK